MNNESLNAIPCYALTFSAEEEKVVFEACRERGLPEDLDGIKALVMEAAGGEIPEYEQDEIDLADVIKQYVSKNPEKAAQFLEGSGLMLKGFAGPIIKRVMSQMKKAG